MTLAWIGVVITAAIWIFSLAVLWAAYRNAPLWGDDNEDHDQQEER